MKIITLLLIFSCFSTIYAQEVTLANRQFFRHKVLYLGFANELSILTNGKYKIEDLSFEAENTEIQVDKEKETMIVIPRYISVTIKIFHKNTLLQKEIFLVFISQIPRLHLLIGEEQTEHILGKSIAKEKLTSITFQVRLDRNIALDIPFDCQYQVTHVEIFLTRGDELVGEPIISINHTVNLESLIKNAQKGDRLVAYIRKVERLNYKGAWVEEQIFREDRIVSLGIE
jgi:hypothetical protein